MDFVTEELTKIRYRERILDPSPERRSMFDVRCYHHESMDW